VRPLQSNIEILNKENFTITVSDNGPGILKEDQESILSYEVAAATDKFGDRGTGIGLATVKS
jgi:signal transduction histidine kinase